MPGIVPGRQGEVDRCGPCPGGAHGLGREADAIRSRGKSREQGEGGTEPGVGGWRENTRLPGISPLLTLESQVPPGNSSFQSSGNPSIALFHCFIFVGHHT